MGLRVQYLRNSARHVSAVLKALLLAGAVGCGSNGAGEALHDVGGTVTYKGNPVGYGHVTLYPQNGPPVPPAILGENGTFSLKAAAGRYKVVVEAIPPPEGARPDPHAESGFDYSRAKPARSLVPLKYSRPETSDVEIEVSGDSECQLTISLR